MGFVPFIKEIPESSLPLPREDCGPRMPDLPTCSHRAASGWRSGRRWSPATQGVASLSSFRRMLLSLGSEPCVSHLAPEISSSSSVKWDCCPYLVAPSCLTLWDPMGRSPPGSWDSPGKNILLHRRQIPTSY